ncbi:hypothetical protein [Pseudopontixanthobacter vadosimaris]|uniref:hypothetical protein n=1 Tax=Pseudopontixanthobacter vadosimaris TaxID=2726450 RepID=UPI0014732E67|nr:hypothetical protein [Pseudopontixanthobacter vadosimaris]
MTILPLVLLLAACDQEQAEPGPAVQTATLTGLYQAAGQDRARSRLCILAPDPGNAAFGLVVQNAGASCSGAGEADRNGNSLRLTMAGAEPCTILASIDGTRITFPPDLPAACAYYCGPGGDLAGVTLNKTGGSTADAMRALDPAGDPLCG